MLKIINHEKQKYLHNITIKNNDYDNGFGILLIRNVNI